MSPASFPNSEAVFENDQPLGTVCSEHWAFYFSLAFFFPDKLSFWSFTCDEGGKVDWSGFVCLMLYARNSLDSWRKMSPYIAII